MRLAVLCSLFSALCLPSPALPPPAPSLPSPASVKPAPASVKPPPAALLDLGQGLTYVRLHRLPDDLAAVRTAWTAAALIVDIRYPSDGGAQAPGLDLPPRPRTAPLFVLVGPATPAGLAAALHRAAPNLITLGAAAPGVPPDIVLAVKPDVDRQAYDALDAGASVDSLIGEKSAQTRFDEAALAREHENGRADAPDQEAKADVRSDVLPDATTAGPSGAAAPAATANATPPPLKDLVLERAVQLHRALLALGMLRER